MQSQRVPRVPAQPPRRRSTDLLFALLAGLDEQVSPQSPVDPSAWVAMLAAPLVAKAWQSLVRRRQAAAARREKRQAAARAAAGVSREPGSAGLDLAAGGDTMDELEGGDGRGDGQGEPAQAAAFSPVEEEEGEEEVRLEELGSELDPSASNSVASRQGGGGSSSSSDEGSADMEEEGGGGGGRGMGARRIGPWLQPWRPMPQWWRRA